MISAMTFPSTWPAWSSSAGDGGLQTMAQLRTAREVRRWLAQLSY